MRIFSFFALSSRNGANAMVRSRGWTMELFRTNDWVRSYSKMTANRPFCASFEGNFDFSGIRFI